MISAFGGNVVRFGPVIEPYRKNVFLACKTGKRTADEAQQELQESLRLLKTDHIDLYQHHAVTTVEEVETILGPGGAMEYFLRARDQGLVRYLGFSAHSEEAAIAMLDAFGFDSVLFPVNWVTYHTGGFGPRVIAAAGKRGSAILALKALAKRKWYNEEERKLWPKAWYRPVETYEEAELGLRFTLSQPVTAAVSPGHEELFDWMLAAEKRFTPLDASELQRLKERAADLDPIFAV